MKKYNVIMFINAKNCDTSCVANVHRLPLITALGNNIKTNKVLLIAQPVCLSTAIFNDKIRLFNLFFHPIKKIQDNLFLFTPVSILPISIIVKKFSFMINSYQYLLKKQILKQMSKIGFIKNNKLILWVTHPYHYYFLSLLGENYKVYECYDDFTMIANFTKEDEFIKSLEKKLSINMNLILATSKKLENRFQKNNHNTSYFSNGVDFDFFSKSLNNKLEIAQDIKNISHPIIGFMGSLSNWYDYNFLKDVVKKSPKNWSFVFIGSIDNNVKQEVQSLTIYNNVYFLGWKDYCELPNYLKEFDVAILPYKINEFMESVNPNKIYQFMSKGIPIVSTGIPEVLNFKNLIRIANIVEDFVCEIEKVLLKKQKGNIDDLIACAKNNSWDKRVDFFYSLIERNK
jgi:hypothetical protein